VGDALVLYLFFVCQADGVSNAFFEYELKTDRDAAALAFMMLNDHPDCDHVNVWQSERFVLKRAQGAGTSFGPALHSPE